jgi:Fe-S-cluster containining protein
MKNKCIRCGICCIYFEVEVYPQDFLRFPGIHVEDDGITLKRAGERCPYLTNNNMCSIYKKRPNACREYDCDSDLRIKRLKGEV